MNSILDAADYIVSSYPLITGEVIDDLKVHQLLYCLQRESFALTGKPAFEGDFEGWSCGPISPDVEAHIKNDRLVVDAKPLSESLREMARNVVLNYGVYAVWKLQEMLCKELSWRNSRKGLGAEDRHTRILLLSDIQKDAKKVRPYDPVWDMYYDEFEDATPEEIAKWSKEEQ